MMRRAIVRVTPTDEDRMIARHTLIRPARRCLMTYRFDTTVSSAVIADPDESHRHLRKWPTF